MYSQDENIMIRARRKAYRFVSNNFTMPKGVNRRTNTPENNKKTNNGEQSKTQKTKDGATII